MTETKRIISIFAPITGKLIDLSEVPDKMFSKRLLGDGIAIIPEDGAMYSPINGYITVIAEDGHAYGFVTDDGLEILIHVGIESKNIEEMVTIHQKVNSRVQAGDLVAEFDIAKMEEAGINTITPVIICGGLEGKNMKPATGHVLAGSGAILTIEETRPVEELASGNVPAQATPQPPEKTPEPKAESLKVQQDSELMSFLTDSSNWPKLIGGLVGLTLVLVIIFVGLALMIGR